MNIFNSLGSNYSGLFIWRNFITAGSHSTTKELQTKLAKAYGGKATLTYKGRQALELAIANSGLPKDSAVGISGFTCYVVYQAVVRAGYRPVPIDITPHGLQFGVSELQKAHRKEPKLNAIIIQNTLGFPADMPALEAYCRQHKVLVIEDLAHSVGAVYADGKLAGTVGAFTILSFSQDKSLDVVAGGALIDRRAVPRRIKQPEGRVGRWQREKNALYPLWTAIIRDTYPIGLGRYFHFGLKKLHLLATPMSDNLAGISAMEPSAAKLLVKAWGSRARELERRRNIATIYQKNLPKQVQIEPLAGSVPSYLRFPVVVKDRAALVAYLKSCGLYIGDTWYDAPIAPARYLKLTDYNTGDCPRAEELAAHIVNLPTHRQVSEANARAIAQEVNTWLTTNERSKSRA